MTPSRVLFGGMLGVVLMSACVLSKPAFRLYNTTDPKAVDVVLLGGGDNRIARTVAGSFLRNAYITVAEFPPPPADEPEHPAEVPRLEASIRELAPKAVVALGGRSIAFAESRLRDFQRLYGLAMRADLEALGRKDVAGVALETSTASEFMLYRMVLNSLAKVTTFYAPQHAGRFIPQAIKELQSLHIDLQAVPVKSAEELLRTYKGASEHTGVVWMMNDSAIFDAAAFARLREETEKNHQPLLCSSLREFAAAGAFMAVDIDFDNVGAQLADMADDVVQGSSMEDIGLLSPIGGKLIVNMNTAEMLKIDVPTFARPLISEMLGIPHR